MDDSIFVSSGRLWKSAAVLKIGSISAASDAMIFHVHEADAAADLGDLFGHSPPLGGIARPRRAEIDHRHIGEGKLAGGRQHRGAPLRGGKGATTLFLRKLSTQTLRRIARAEKHGAASILAAGQRVHEMFLPFRPPWVTVTSA